MDSKSDNPSLEKFPPPGEHGDAPINAHLNGTETNTADSGPKATDSVAKTANGCPVTTENGPKTTDEGPETTDGGLIKESLEDGDGSKTGEVVQNGITGEAKMKVTLEDLPDDDEDKNPCAKEDEHKREGEVKTARPANARKTAELEIKQEDNHLDPRNQKWSEALKAKLFASVDKDSNFFSYMFLDKIFGEARPCRFCGARGTAKLPPRDESLKLCVLEDGIVGRQNVLCTRCGEIDTVVSCDDVKRFPADDRMSITGAEIRAYCRNITHYEILHDLMEMLHIAATDDDSQRQEKHHEVADFMLKNVRRVCEEWCKPEYAELRLKKYLRLRDETLLTTYNPTFTPDCTEEYKEMYEMMANSFRQNRDKVLLLLQLMKESLIDSPTRSTFMMWVSIAMMHSESYSQFKTAYDPRSFMRVDSSEYQALQDRYLALEVPLGIKKIPVIFILFEIPRFYHYVEFLNQRIGRKKPRNYLTDEERATLQTIEEETLKMGLKMKPRTGKMVSPEAHLDFLTRQEEYGREMIYQSCRDKEKAKQQKSQNALKAATSVKGKHSASGNSNSGSSSPSSTRKTESTKSTTVSSSSVASGGNSERERHSSPSLGSSEASKPIPNKKKKKKNRALHGETDTPSPSPASVEEKLTKKKVEDDARRRRDEFISDDHLKAILRETIKASVGGGEDGEGGDGKKKKKKKKGHAKRVQVDGETPTKSSNEQKTTSKEDNCAKEAEEKPLQEDSKIEKEKELLKEEKDNTAKEEEVNSATDDKKHMKDVGEEENSDKVTAEEKYDTEKGDEEAGEQLEKQTNGLQDKQVPKAIKPEVNPDSPLANVSLPPRPGLDPNRKPISLPSLEPTSTPATKYTTRSSLKKELREQMKASKRHKKSGRDSTTVLCAQVDTEMLRAQGYKISGNSPVTTVVANSDGTIEHILEGLNTPEQVKAFLSRRYSILNQQAGSGYLTMPSKDDPGAIVVDPGKEINPFINNAAAKFSDGTVEPKIAGNPKKRKKARNAQQQPTISSLMDCYAQQREQCKSGGWKAGYEQHQQEELMGGVLDEAMCGALGGGDLNKALSTAFKGAMAQAQMQGSDESGSGKGWSGMGSYRINSDGSVSEAHMYDPVDLVGSSSSSNNSSNNSGNKSKTTTNDKGGSASIRPWKGGKRSARFRGSGSRNGKGSSKATSSAVSTKNASGKTAVKDKYCVADPESLIAVGTMSTIGWSDAKRDLFKNHMCRGLDEKVATVDTEDEAREIFLEAMKPCDLGKLEGPCPRYVVPSSGGLGQLTGSFPLPEVGNVRDFDDFLKSPAAPRQQMTLLDAMRFPYKLETTKVYIRRKDKDGNELPPKCTMVSKVTMLPKELAERYCFVGDAGIIHELVDPENDIPTILSTDDEIKKLLEIEAPHSRDEPPPKILSSADFELDTPPDIAVESITKVLRESIINNPKLRESSLTLQGLNDSIIGVLKDMPTAKLVGYKEDFGENDSELGITLPNDITMKSLTAGESGSGGAPSSSHHKKKKIKKKPKKPNPTTSQNPTEDTPSIATHAKDETPISINGQEVGVSDTPTTEHTNVPDPTSESVRDIDDIDDIEIGVSEDLLMGAGVGSGLDTAATEDSASKASQSKVAAREKFRSCENCGSIIEERILVCSGCKKVAYCDRKCQKAHWKAHKRTCSHKVTKEDCTG